MKELVFLHLLTIVGSLLVPFGNVIGPYVYWKLRKSKSRDVEMLSRHARNVLNFQLTCILIIYAGSIVFWYLVIKKMSEGLQPDYGNLAWCLIALIGLCIVYPLINMFRAGCRRSSKLCYPKAIPFFKG